MASLTFKSPTVNQFKLNRLSVSTILNFVLHNRANVPFIVWFLSRFLLRSLGVFPCSLGIFSYTDICVYYLCINVQADNFVAGM